MKLQTKQEGFTLIEMMVVIAVIGILSAAVLAGLGPSRAKARDARIISAVQQIRSLAEAVYDPASGTPYGALSTDLRVTTLKSDVTSQGGDLQVLPDGFGYVAYSKLASSANYFCVDSAGNAGTQASAPSGACTPAFGGAPPPRDEAATGLAAGAVCLLSATSNPCATGSCQSDPDNPSLANGICR